MAYSGDGKGTKDNPYKITNLFQFMESFKYPDAYFEFKNGMTFDYCADHTNIGSITIKTNDTEHSFSFSKDKYNFKIVKDIPVEEQSE